MSGASRRRKASVSPERMALYRFIAGLEAADVAVARAMLSADGVSEDAARLMRVPAATFRYRDSAFLRRVSRAIPGFLMPSGRAGRDADTLSYDQVDGLGVAAGIES